LVQSEEAGAPPHFVQAVFEEKKPTDRFLGGSRVSGQIWIRGDIRPAERKPNGTR